MVRVNIIQDGPKYVVRVGVASTKKPNLWANRDIDPGQAASEENLKKLIAASAYLCAAYLDEKYGDSIDPGIVGREAVREFGKECMLVALLQSGIPAKISQLKRMNLTDWQEELLARMTFQLERGQVLTQNDVDWIDKILRDETVKK